MSWHVLSSCFFAPKLFQRGFDSNGTFCPLQFAWVEPFWGPPHRDIHIFFGVRIEKLGAYPLPKTTEELSFLGSFDEKSVLLHKIGR